MNADDWIELDELARSTIMLTLHKAVYFNVKDTNGAYGVWSALSNLYEKKSAASQVYWLKKLIDLRMESTPMSNHLNEFHTIVSQLQSQGVEFDDSVRAMFLLVTLPNSWDTFRTTVSNSTAPDGLKCADIESSLLMEEVNCKNVEDTKSSSAMHVRGRSRSRGNFERRDKSKSRTRSKSRLGKGVECYYCHKKGHMKKDCYKFKRDKKKDSDDKRKGKNASDDREENTLTFDKGKCIVASLPHVYGNTHNETFAKKIKQEIDKLKEAEFIYEIEHFDWVSSIVVVLKTNGKLRVCVNLKKVNVATI
ncbi:hypothetical protein L7F22_039575 [Adiantum nelumboides]|nr:hypothetical protein [Adiantum nelumboides]